MNDIFKIAKKMRKDNQDITGEKCIKDDSDKLSMDDQAKKVAWKQHYSPGTLKIYMLTQSKDLPYISQSKW